MQKILRLINY